MVKETPKIFKLLFNLKDTDFLISIWPHIMGKQLVLILWASFCDLVYNFSIWL